MASTSALITPPELARRATLVVVVKPTGESHVHWNSATNVKWANGEDPALIYRDDSVAVERVLFGVSGEEVIVRTVGGIVGDYWLDFEGQPELTDGATYLLMLESVETPTKEGIERAWVPIGFEQGVFIQDATGWFNESTGVRITQTEPHGIVFACDAPSTRFEPVTLPAGYHWYSSCE